MSVRLDRLQRALVSALGDAAETVLWIHGEMPHENISTGTVIALSLTAGPTPVFRSHVRGRLITPADSVVVRILDATEGVRLLIRVNEFAYYHDVTALDTVTSIRDALLADISADEPDITVTTDGVDGISLAADHLGALRTVELVGGDSQIDNDPPVFSGDAVLVTEASQTHLVNVQCYSKQRELRFGATAVAQTAHDLLQAEDILEQIDREGFAIWALEGITDISAISGARWETRATFDVTLASKSFFVRPVPQIETLNVVLNAAE